MKINKDSLFIVFCLLAFIRPDSLNLIPGVTSFYYIYRVIVVLLLYLLFIIRKVGIDNFSLVWIGFELVIVFSTIINQGNIGYAVFQALTIIAMMFLFKMYSNRLLLVCKNIYKILAFFVSVNFITILMFPQGMYSTGITNTTADNWFLGFKNEQTAYFLPLIGLVFILLKIEGFKKSRFCVLLITVVSAFLIHSSTLLVGLSILLIIEFVPFIRKNSKVFNLGTYFIFTLLMFISIPILRLQNVFSFIIENILGKSLTLSNRTIIWDKAIYSIFQHPILGWGETVNSLKYQLYNSFSVVTAHNQILEYTFTGGLVLITLYLIINIMLIKKTWNIKSDEVVQIISGIYLALQVTLITEVFNEVTIFMIYFLVWYSKELSEYPRFKRLKE